MRIHIRTRTLGANSHANVCMTQSLRAREVDVARHEVGFGGGGKLLEIADGAKHSVARAVNNVRGAGSTRFVLLSSILDGWRARSKPNSIIVVLSFPQRFVPR